MTNLLTDTFTMNRIKMNALPTEILVPFVCNVNAHTCKRWLNIWYAKPVNICLQFWFHNKPLISCPKYTFSKFINIVTLELSDQTVIASDVTLPATLTKLILNQNKYVTATMMYALTNLTVLHFGNGAQITNTVLRELVSVTTLKLIDNDTISEDSLLCLRDLRCLDIKNCSGITDACLKKMTSLTALVLDEMPHLSCKTLTKMTSLKSIRFYKFHIYDEVLAKMTQLGRLEFYDNTIVSRFSIWRLTNLTALAFFNKVDIQMADIDRLPKLKELRFVRDGKYGKWVGT